MCSTYPRFPLSVPNAHPFANFARPSDEAPRSPWDLYRSYGLKPDMDAGSGVTAAIVVAFGSPTLQRDFDEFNRYFGLPAAEVEIRYSGTEPSVFPENWQIETTADVCWLHAAAPGAKLLSVFASGADISALMEAALFAAERADIVSMSFGSAEFRGQTDYDRQLAETGKLFVASSGDTGGAVLYPSASDAVISVGGAIFHRNAANGRIFAYSAWENGGGGPSLYTGIPNWQNRFKPIAALTNDMRGTPDIAMDACQSPGYAVFDGKSERFRGICGTSIGAPVFSGMCARYFNENGEKASSRAVCERLYALAGGVLYNKKEAKDSFYDVIIGSNGRFDALIGYDLCTGLGVPTR